MSGSLPTIRTLLGHSSGALALKCFASLRRMHVPEFQLAVHDDGSLTAEDREQICGLLPGSTFISPGEAAAAMEPVLRAYPACRAFREKYAVSAKLLDIPLMNDGPLVYCDSDILFVRPFTGFRRLLEGDNAPKLVLMRDFWNTYAIRYWHLFNPGHLPLMDRLNSGILLAAPGALDLDFLEAFLRMPSLTDLPHIEQTYWSALMCRIGGRVLSPDQFYYPGVSGPPPSQPVAWHLVGSLRDRLTQYPETLYGLNEPPVDARTIRSEKLTILRYFRTRWDRQLWLWQGRKT